MTVPWQIAQKLHACTATFSPPKSNDRAHDLVDLQLLEVLLADADLEQIRSACVAVFKARAEHAWPPAVRAHPHWSSIYNRACEGLDHLCLAGTADEAAKRVDGFVRRIGAAIAEHSDLAPGTRDARSIQQDAHLDRARTTVSARPVGACRLIGDVRNHIPGSALP